MSLNFKIVLYCLKLYIVDSLGGLEIWEDHLKCFTNRSHRVYGYMLGYSIRVFQSIRVSEDIYDKINVKTESGCLYNGVFFRKKERWRGV